MPRFLKSLGLSSAVLLFQAATPTISNAEPIIVTETVTGSGSLKGIGFTDELITITFRGNTDNQSSPTTGEYIITGGVTSVTVADTGSATLASGDKLLVYSDKNTNPDSAGVYDDSSNPPAPTTLLGTSSNAFENYDLTTSFGPTSGTAIFNSGLSAATAGGSTFNISSVSTQSTFTAVVVPEPSSVILAGSGFLGLAGFRHVRRRGTA